MGYEAPNGSEVCVGDRCKWGKDGRWMDTSSSFGGEKWMKSGDCLCENGWLQVAAWEEGKIN